MSFFLIIFCFLVIHPLLLLALICLTPGTTTGVLLVEAGENKDIRADFELLKVGGVPAENVGVDTIDCKLMEFDV